MCFNFPPLRKHCIWLFLFLCVAHRLQVRKCMKQFWLNNYSNATGRFLKGRKGSNWRDQAVEWSATRREKKKPKIAQIYNMSLKLPLLFDSAMQKKKTLMTIIITKQKTKSTLRGRQIHSDTLLSSNRRFTQASNFVYFWSIMTMSSVIWSLIRCISNIYTCKTIAQSRNMGRKRGFFQYNTYILHPPMDSKLYMIQTSHTHTRTGMAHACGLYCNTHTRRYTYIILQSAHTHTPLQTGLG